ncbi:DUF4265 domain-containing protein [Acinetobacter bereziniae]|uniref:DUF4265 domain-containing protein n=1 Tax=Acinetobacter bereziniae TaxID=106648 RepID=UPI0018FF9A25|nr:DUF4265 domain-containing protein [Acinetobacter bereziniae]MBJ8553289.1 DUF4265 domain-containing protein [Acinetobacter bereziniae]
MNVEKIIVPYYNVDNILSKEIIFGQKISDDKYVIENIPLYAPNLALGDVLLIEKLDDGKLYFEDLLETSGNSTIRIVFFKYDPIIVQKILKEIEMYNINWIGFDGGSYYSLNIDKDLDYKKIKLFLEENSKIIDYQESCLSEKHRSDLL